METKQVKKFIKALNEGEMESAKTIVESILYTKASRLVDQHKIDLANRVFNESSYMNDEDPDTEDFDDDVIEEDDEAGGDYDYVDTANDYDYLGEDEDVSSDFDADRTDFSVDDEDGVENFM